MTNTDLLKAKIESSGYKLKYIAAKIGLSYQGFSTIRPSSLHRRSRDFATCWKSLSKRKNRFFLPVM